MKKIAIIGGGLSGLTLAYVLLSKNKDIELSVIESDIRPGGKVAWAGQDACRRYQQVWTVDKEDWVFPTVACRDAAGGWIFPGLPESNRVARAGNPVNPWRPWGRRP